MRDSGDNQARTRHFQIGVVSVTVTSEMPDLLEQYSSLYRHWHVDDPQDNSIDIQVRRKPFSPWHRRRWEVIANDSKMYEPTRNDEVFTYVEWATNWEVPRVMPQYLQLHASSMEVDGAGVIFPGQSGSGKSTLTTGLLSRGWRYLCDEFALIHAETLRLHPFPRAICVKKPSHPIIESLGLSIHENRSYHKGCKGVVGFVDPLSVSDDAVGRVCPIRYVIFPKYAAGAKPELIEISKGQAAFDLHEVCFNLFGCSALGLDVIAEMIRGTQCYRLVAGEIKSTCEVVERLVGSGSRVSCPSIDHDDPVVATSARAEARCACVVDTVAGRGKTSSCPA